MTSEPSQQTLFDMTELPLMSSLAASPAKTSVTLASELASKVRGLVCGESTRDSLASYDHATQSWRTSQACLVSGWAEFSETWPRSGTTRCGTAYQLAPSALLTDEIASGLLPTPTAGDSKASGSRNTTSSKAHAGISLTDAVRQDGGRGRMWPTPTASTGGARVTPRGTTDGVKLEEAVRMWRTPNARALGGGEYQDPEKIRKRIAAGHQINLSEQVKLAEAEMWPTPASRDYRYPNKTPYSERGGGTKGEQLPNAVGGALNPTWVEWLMGYPLGWTDLGHSETP